MKAILTSMGYLIMGPNESAYVASEKQIKRKKNTLARRNGFEADDYTATEVFIKSWKFDDNLTPKELERAMWKKLPRGLNWEQQFKQQAAAEVTNENENEHSTTS